MAARWVRGLRFNHVQSLTELADPTADPYEAVHRYPVWMPFLQPEAPGRSGDAPGSIDYRFARRQLLHRYRSGELTRGDVCDAQAELIRIALNHSRKATSPCPICAQRELRIVRFVFGSKLPAGGRVVENNTHLLKLSERYGGSSGARTYSVEICLACRWNHLLDIVPMGAKSR